MLGRAGAALLYGAMLGAASLGGAWADDLLIRAPSYQTPAPAGMEATAPQTRPWRLIDSRWGYVPAINLAVANALEACPDYDTGRVASLRLSPSRFTAVTTQAVIDLRACRPELFPKDSPPGAIGTQAWKALMPDAAPPTVLDRTRVIAFGASALTADYDRAAWNLERPDKDAILTWGPFRATAGGGCTLQKLLAELAADPATAAPLAEAFIGEEAVLAQLLERKPDWCAGALAILQPVYDDPERRDAFPIRFAQLAANEAARAGYDRYFLGPKGYLAARMAQYYGLYARARIKPTEADFAFFLDHALGYPPFTPQLTAQLDKAIKAMPRKQRQNWRVRRLIANALPYRLPGSRAFALGRDGAFFVDGAGEAGLTEEERQAWLTHSRTRASDVGLTDRPYQPPCAVVWLDACGPRGPL